MLDSVVKAIKQTLSSNTLGRMQIWTKKDKNGEPYSWWFRKKFVWWVWSEMILMMKQNLMMR